jgi:hypothetical protein
MEDSIFAKWAQICTKYFYVIKKMNWVFFSSFLGLGHLFGHRSSFIFIDISEPIALFLHIWEKIWKNIWLIYLADSFSF